MYLARTVKYCAPGALRNLRVASLMAIMPNTHTFHTGPSLNTPDAQPFSTLEGVLNPALLKGLDDMGFDKMTPVQSKVLGGLRPLRRDW